MIGQQRIWRCLLLVLLTIVTIPATALTSLQCKIAAIHYETGGESLRDKKMTLQVVENRMRILHKRACQVVLAKNQFSFVNGHTVSQLRWEYSQEDLTEYKKLSIMNAVVGKDVVSFHNVNVSPSWARHMRKRGRIGKHFVYSSKAAI